MGPSERLGSPTLCATLTCIKRSVASLRYIGFALKGFAGKAALPFNVPRREQLKQFWREGMTALGLPGIGYAFINRNGIVEEGGSGREIRQQTRSDRRAYPLHGRVEHQGMTRLLLAKLVDPGELAWDEPVVQADPAFCIGDPQVQQNIKIRHLICACTGIPRQDQEWIMSGGLNTPAGRAFTLLAPTKPTSGLGEMYQYSNLLASAAGYIAGHIEYLRTLPDPVPPGQDVRAYFNAHYWTMSTQDPAAYNWYQERFMQEAWDRREQATSVSW